MRVHVLQDMDPQVCVSLFRGQLTSERDIAWAGCGPGRGKAGRPEMVSSRSQSVAPVALIGMMLPSKTNTA